MNGVGGITAAAGTMSQKGRLAATCKEFEAMFLSMMMKTMRESVPESDFMAEGRGEKLFREMRDDALCQEMGRAGGIGLGDALYKELLAKMEVS